ncbi:hypothetical protein MSTO_42670 [Mycobacterium stomatepiae]|uniref:Uncharacterized protein n=1 Tax=Mycobacterium stomatepiae TaxID=470076 RepID=A0A7I7QD82_9MYCO|nr:hypothetical protein MSTO_42670 [Mycobacterium stomatepiae]
MPGTGSGEELFITGADEKQPEVTYRSKTGVRRGPGDTGEVQGEPGRDEIDDYPIRPLPGAANAALIPKDMHRKTLMPQSISCLLVDMLAELGDRRPW